MIRPPRPLPARMIGWIVSPRLGVACLALLMILTFWGTVYQVYGGLYAAQQRFFIRGWC